MRSSGLSHVRTLRPSSGIWTEPETQIRSDYPTSVFGTAVWFTGIANLSSTARDLRHYALCSD